MVGMRIATIGNGCSLKEELKQWNTNIKSQYPNATFVFEFIMWHFGQKHIMVTPFGTLLGLIL